MFIKKSLGYVFPTQKENIIDSIYIFLWSLSLTWTKNNKILYKERS